MQEEIKTYNYNPIQEKIVKVLQNKNQSKEGLFFRVLASYYFSKMAANMRTFIDVKDIYGLIPVNTYAVVLATSGAGKGKSVNIIENDILKGFKDKFIKELLPTVVEKNLAKLASERASISGLDPDEVYNNLMREYKGTGPFLFNFDGGTAAAIKQLRHKLLLAGIGAMNLEMDEVGANLSANIDMLNVFIELYDVGKVKPKITKNTQENKRNESIDGVTPANVLLFGTPSKLLDSGKTEQDFYSLLDMGYARRMIFAYMPKISKEKVSAKDKLEMLRDKSSGLYVATLYKQFEDLVEESNTNKKLFVNDTTLLKLLDYQTYCEERADKLKEHQEMEKAELMHRYFRALKLAGAYAFVEGEDEVKLEHLQQAIKLIEDSGNAFRNILKREKSYVKLAKYIAELDEDVTHADLHEDLPFYRGSASAKREMLDLAIAWGYKHSVIIKRKLIDGIEFLSGEALQEFNPNEVILSYSDDMTYNYTNRLVEWDKLPKLFELDNYHWINHHLKDGDKGEGHRLTANAIPGFNLVVLDVDGTAKLEMVKELLKDYSYHIYTTKRHDPVKEHRFRVVLPLSHVVKLGVDEYKEFMNNLFEWLPFEVDKASNQIVKKWLTNKDCEIYSNEGSTLNAMWFIPNTKKAEEMTHDRALISSMSNLEAWFYREFKDGNRNNVLFKYAKVLKDNGYDLESIKNALLAFNSKTPNPLEEREIYDTVIVSIAREFK